MRQWVQEQGWVLFKQMCVFSGIHFIKHFIEFVFVETSEVLCSNSNVILMRQTCGHRSSRVAERKHQALAFYFSIRIWYVFMISKLWCRGESDLGLCMTSKMQRECGCTMPTSDFEKCFAAKFVGSRHCSGAFLLQVPKQSSTFWYWEHIPNSYGKIKC